MTGLYLYLISLLSIPFFTGDRELDTQLYAMTIEAEERQERWGRCVQGYILIKETKLPYKPMPSDYKVTKPTVGRELT